MSNSSGPVFGTTKMGETVADSKDLTGILQQGAISSNTFPEDAVEGCVVQLTANVGDKVAGHFYQYVDMRTISGTVISPGSTASPFKWIDVTAYVKSLAATDYVCEYFSYGYASGGNVVGFEWVDQDTSIGGAPWCKTTIYEVDNAENPKEEIPIYTSVIHNECSERDDGYVTVTIDDDRIVWIEDMKFIIEFTFADGTRSRGIATYVE